MRLSAGTGDVMVWVRRIAAAGLLLFAGAVTRADGAFSGKVIDIAVEWMPGSVVFRLDTPTPGCPLYAGAYWLQYTPASSDGMKAAYAAVLAVQLSQRQMLLGVTGVTSSGMCNVVWLHPQAQ